MTNDFALGMAEATRLTKAGKLVEATLLIQSLLTAKAPEPVAEPNEAVVEGTFSRLDDSPSAKHGTLRPAGPDGPRRRTSLRETLQAVAVGRMPNSAPLTRQKLPTPDGARFVTMTHANRHGQRDYKLYIPASRRSSRMPLIVMLHGCTQSPDDFAAGTGMNALAERHGLVVAYPAQPTRANANKCWNWFKPEDQTRDRGEPALIAGLTRDILRDHPVDSARVYIAGLSAGGAAAMIVAAAYPDLFSAVGVHSGLPVGAALDIQQAFSAMRSGSNGIPLFHAVPTIVIHGTADATVHPRNGAAVVAQTLHAFGELEPTICKGVSAGGRSFQHISHKNGDGRSMVESWEIDGAGHAWAGGHAKGTFTDPAGPGASEEMLRFFLQHSRG